jgi:hypothetical protein
MADAEGTGAVGLWKRGGSGKVAGTPGLVGGDDDPAAGHRVFAQLWQSTNPFFLVACWLKSKL